MTEETDFLLLDDIQYVYKRGQKYFLMFGLVGLCIMAFAKLMQPLQYEIRGSFREASGTKGKNASGVLSSFFVKTDGMQSKAIMLSKALLSQVVSRNGLQIVSADTSFLEQLFDRVYKNFQIERKKFIPPKEKFYFRDVIFDREVGADLNINFVSSTEFDAIYEGEKVRGQLQEKMKIKDFVFTLINAPKETRPGRFYKFSVSPAWDIAAELEKKIVLEEHDLDSSISLISLPHEDQKEGIHLVNTLMDVYVDYLIKENERFGVAQIDFLVKHREDLTQRMSQNLIHHIESIKDNKDVGLYAYMDLDTQLSYYAQTLQQFDGKFADIDLALYNLDRPTDLVSLGGEISRLEIEKNLLIQRRDALTLSLLPRLPYKIDSDRPEKSFTGFEDLALPKGVMQQVLRAISLRNNVQDHVFFDPNLSKEFDGINLQTADGLFLKYRNILDEVQKEIVHLGHLVTEVEKDDFELSTLGNFVEGSVLSRAMQLMHLTRDGHNITEKDMVRMKEDIQVEKKSIIAHLKQKTQLLSLELDLTRNKIDVLQRVYLDLINQEIEIIKQQLRDAIQEKKDSLLVHKSFLEKKLDELDDVMQAVPEKWRQEKQGTIQVELTRGVIQGINQLVDSKFVEHQLNQIESRPLDRGYSSPQPKAPQVMKMMAVGAVGGYAASFVLTLLYFIVRGIPQTLSTLRYRGRHVSGSLSQYPSVEGDGDLETLRNLNRFLDGNVVSVIGGKGPNYADVLAEMLGFEEKKVLVVRADFDGIVREGDSPGLLQYLLGEEEVARVKEGDLYDVLPMGGTTRLGAELFKRGRFEQFLLDVQKNYDMVLFYTHALPATAVAKAFMGFSDQICVTVNEEKLEDLLSYFAWEDARERQCLTFVDYRYE